MEIIRRRSRLNESQNVWWDRNITTICRERLGLYFDIPESVRTIWISLHTEPSEDRLSVTVSSRAYGASHIEPCREHVYYDFIYYYGTGLPCEKARVLFAQVEYEE